MRLLILLSILLAVCLVAAQEPNSAIEEETSTGAETTIQNEPTRPSSRRQKIRTLFNRRNVAQRRTKQLSNTTPEIVSTTPKPIAAGRNSLISRNLLRRPRLRGNRGQSTTTEVTPFDVTDLPEETDTILTDSLVNQDDTVVLANPTTTTSIPQRNSITRGSFRGRTRTPQLSVNLEKNTRPVSITRTEQTEDSVTTTEVPTTPQRSRGSHRFRTRLNPTGQVKVNPTSSRSRSRIQPSTAQISERTSPVSSRPVRRRNRVRTSKLNDETSTTPAPPAVSTESVIDLANHEMSKKMQENMKEIKEMKEVTDIDEMMKKIVDEPITTIIPEEDIVEEENLAVEATVNPEDILDETKDDPIKDDMSIFSTNLPKESPPAIKPIPAIHRLPSLQPLRAGGSNVELVKPLVAVEQQVKPIQSTQHRFNTQRGSRPVNGQSKKVERKESFSSHSFSNAEPLDNTVEETSNRSTFRQRFRNRVNPGVIKPAAFQPARDPLEVEALAAIDFGSDFSTTSRPIKLRPLVIRRTSENEKDIKVTTFRPPHDINQLLAVGRKSKEVLQENNAISQDEQLSPKNLEITTEINPTEESIIHGRKVQDSPAIAQRRRRIGSIQRKSTDSTTTTTTPEPIITEISRNVNNNARRRNPINVRTQNNFNRQRSSQTSRGRFSMTKEEPTTTVPLSKKVVTPSPVFAAPLSNDALSPIHETSHKVNLPIPNYGTSDLLYKSGDVVITEIGTVEDTNPDEVELILSGLGGRRRGLARPPTSQQPKTTTTTLAPIDEVLAEYYDYYYDNPNEYEYVYEYTYADEAQN